MSLKYRDKNGAEVVLAGLTPGGDLEYGAVATRKGTWSLPQTAAGNAYATIVFTEPMPDADYEINLEVTSVHWTSAADNHTPFMIQDKTANGFTIKFYTFNGFQSVDGNYTAYKLYEVADAEQLYSKVQDLEAMVPANASSTNKFTTADDLRTETRTLDRRLDDVEDVIPTGASVSNQLATKADVDNATIDELGDIGDVDVSTVTDGQTIIWDDTNSKWVNGQGGKVYSAGNGVAISSADQVSAKINTDQLNFDSSGNINVSNDYKKTFVGTRAQWDALSAADKKKYNIANITDDAIDCMTVDTITEGVMEPVTSNAVAKDKKFVTLWSGKVTSGTVTLSQPYTKFRKIYLLMGINGGSSTAKHQAELLTDFIQVSQNMVVSACAGTGTQVYVSGFNLTFTITSITISGAYYYNWTSPSLEKVIGEY